MTYTIECDQVEVNSAGRYTDKVSIKVNCSSREMLEDVSVSDIFEAKDKDEIANEIEIKHFIEVKGIDAILDEIGIDEVRSYFNIAE